MTKTKVISARISEETATKFDELAKRLKKKPSELLRLILETEIDAYTVKVINGYKFSKIPDFD